MNTPPEQNPPYSDGQGLLTLDQVNIKVPPGYQVKTMTESQYFAYRLSNAYQNLTQTPDCAYFHLRCQLLEIVKNINLTYLTKEIFDHIDENSFPTVDFHMVITAIYHMITSGKSESRKYKANPEKIIDLLTFLRQHVPSCHRRGRKPGSQNKKSTLAKKDEDMRILPGAVHTEKTSSELLATPIKKPKTKLYFSKK